jgi:hypothetical protein
MLAELKVEPSADQKEETSAASKAKKMGLRKEQQWEEKEVDQRGDSLEKNLGGD